MGAPSIFVGPNLGIEAEGTILGLVGQTRPKTGISGAEAHYLGLRSGSNQGP